MVLLVLYFVVFGSVRIRPAAVGSLTFAILFAVTVSGILSAGIGGVDKGQWEAAGALGFGRAGAFFRVILPQAAGRMLPRCKGKLVSMLKQTSMVGYISIQDLTKAGDIIRSRTYDAFFPLAVTAAVYFAVSSLILLAAGRVELRLDPRRPPPGTRPSRPGRPARRGKS